MMKKQKPAYGKIILTVAFTLICLVWVMPVVEVVINSFKSNDAINLDVFGLPIGDAFVGFANYLKGLTFGDYPFLSSAFYRFPPC